MNHKFIDTIGLLGSPSKIKDYSWISASSEDNAIERLSIYQNNIAHSLTDALCETYPVCFTLLGEEYFRALSLVYLKDHPPTTPILREFGRNFASFIADFPPLQTQPFLSEVAHLEYQLLELTHSKEEQTLSIEELSEKLNTLTDLDNSVWHFAEHTELHTSQFSSGSIYLAHQPDSEIVLANIDWTSPEYLLLTKSGLWGCCYCLDVDLFTVLSKLKNQQPLAQAFAGIDPDRLPGLMQQLISLSIFTDIQQG